MGIGQWDRRQRTARRTTPWRWTIPSGAAIAALAAVLALAPSASAVSTTHAVVLSAPYHGTITSRSSSLFTSGCGGAQLTSPSFQLSTGLGGTLTKASGPTCRGTGSGGSAYTGISVGVHVPIASSKATIVVLAQLQAHVASQVTVGTCTLTPHANYSYCSQYAFASFYAFAYLIDTTSGAFYVSSNYYPGAYSDQYASLFCYQGSCSSYTNTSGSPITVSTTFGWWFNLTGLTTSDHFQLSFGFYSDAYAAEYAYGAKLSGGTTWAVSNVATHNNGVDLASITIT